jgi:flagellar hook assembly protein FlgD
VLHPSFPNPFAGSTEVRFALAAAGRASLSVYDAQGRVVRRLWSGPVRAGEHVQHWDGRDDAGRPVAGGMYFCRLNALGANLTRKVVLLSGD